MASGVSGWGWNPQDYLGPRSFYYSASYLAVLGLHAFIPELHRNPPGYPQYAWEDSKSPLLSRAVEFRRNINCHVFGEGCGFQPSTKIEEIGREFFEKEADRTEASSSTPQQGISFQDQSLWELATNGVSSWISNLLANGISLDPSTLEKLKDLKGIAGAFGFMLFLLYLTKREPKTDHYHYQQLIFVPSSEEGPAQSDAKKESQSNPLLELELTLKRLNSELNRI